MRALGLAAGVDMRSREVHVQVIKLRVVVEKNTKLVTVDTVHLVRTRTFQSCMAKRVAREQVLVRRTCLMVSRPLPRIARSIGR